MTQKTIDDCINARPEFNCTNMEACVVADRISGWGMKNFKYKFMPVEVVSILLLPKDNQTEIEKDCFDSMMFKPNGMLFNTPMNHYFNIVTKAGHTCLINAGYLARHFYVGEKFAYRELKRLISISSKLPSNITVGQTTEPK